MTTCNENCNTCTNICVTTCPYCGFKGLKVPLETVLAQSLLRIRIENDDAYICTNRKCEAIYFFKNNPLVLTKEKVKSKVWFKSTYKDYIVCYCHNITLDNVVKIIKETNKDNLTKKDIFKLLNIEEDGDCLHYNPIGDTCDKIFEGAIQYAYKQIEN